MSDEDQLGLFAGGAVAGPEVEPFVADEDRERAARIPSFIRFGTSSWSFPGWKGIVWKGAPTEAELAKGGLAAYAQHPLFRTVGLDRTHYRPLRDEDLASYLGQIAIARAKAPELPPFRVVSKVWDEITTAVFPSHPRSGARAGTRNPHFLDASVFLSEVLPPYARVGATGPFVFEITPMPTNTFDDRTFVSKLDGFLSKLPSGHRWAFELRNAERFTPRYLDVLAAHGASHVFNYWTAMPSLRAQYMRSGGGGSATPRLPRFVILRLMLPPFTKYETRKNDFRPFSELREIQSDMRDDVVQILRASADQGSSEVFVLVNNKAEGSSPLTIRALADLTIRAFAR